MKLVKREEFFCVCIGFKDRFSVYEYVYDESGKYFHAMEFSEKDVDDCRDSLEGSWR